MDSQWEYIAEEQGWHSKWADIVCCCEAHSITNTAWALTSKHSSVIVATDRVCVGKEQIEERRILSCVVLLCIVYLDEDDTCHCYKQYVMDIYR